MWKGAQGDTGLHGPDNRLPAVLFRERTERWDAEVRRWDRRIAQLSNARLAAFLAGLAGAAGFGFAGVPVAAWVTGVLFLTGFVVLVAVHEQAYRARTRDKCRAEVNRTAWKRMTDSWHDLPDDGRQFSAPGHAYAEDLDVFGPGSLYQWMQTAVTPAGKACLAGWLSEGVGEPASIRERQGAVRELAPLLDWRQALQVEALAGAEEFVEATALNAWGEADCPIPDARLQWMRRAALVLPFLTLAAGLLPAMSITFRSGPGFAPFGLLVLFQMLLLVGSWKTVAGCLRSVEHVSADLRAHQRMLVRFEALPVQSAQLSRLKARLCDEKGRTAAIQSLQLSRIVDALGNRRHQLYVLVNILFMTDWHFLFAIEKWRRVSGRKLGDWVTVNAELEALCSLAALAHAHPDWAMPEVTVRGEEVLGNDTAEAESRADTHAEHAAAQACDASAMGDGMSGGVPRLLAVDMGHPLLGTACVTNTLRFTESARIALITGSNMSGKSTLLRTVGINLVLAMAGAPVHAARFVFRPGSIFTCMRTRDDMEQGISSFRAELLRIRLLVQAVEEGKEVFFLLDELFKGTNSADRHAGAEALIRWFSRQDSGERRVTGLVSTHDLELGVLADHCPGVWNAHFQEQVEGERLHFDYQLRPGLSTTRNALWLMRMSGLPTGEEEG